MGEASAKFVQKGTGRVDARAYQIEVRIDRCHVTPSFLIYVKDCALCSDVLMQGKDQGAQGQ